MRRTLSVVVLFCLLHTAANRPANGDVTLAISKGALCHGRPHATAFPHRPRRERRELRAGPVRRAYRGEIRWEIGIRHGAVLTSRFFGFKGSIESYVPEETKVLCLHSASQLGRNDMGIDRERYQAEKPSFAAGAKSLTA